MLCAYYLSQLPGIQHKIHGLHHVFALQKLFIAVPMCTGAKEICVLEMRVLIRDPLNLK